MVAIRWSGAERDRLGVGGGQGLATGYVPAPPWEHGDGERRGDAAEGVPAATRGVPSGPRTGIPSGDLPVGAEPLPFTARKYVPEDAFVLGERGTLRLNEVKDSPRPSVQRVRFFFGSIDGRCMGVAVEEDFFMGTPRPFNDHRSWMDANGLARPIRSSGSSRRSGSCGAWTTSQGSTTP